MRIFKGVLKGIEAIIFGYLITNSVRLVHDVRKMRSEVDKINEEDEA